MQVHLILLHLIRIRDTLRPVSTTASEAPVAEAPPLPTPAATPTNPAVPTDPAGPTTPAGPVSPISSIDPTAPSSLTGPSGVQADAQVAAWRALAARHAAITCALERELGDRHGLGISDFEVLERLAESADHKFRVQELADAVHLSQSALSRLIGRLEQHGLVERCLCDLDRRGVYVTLTDEGRHRHTEALPTHRAVLTATLPPNP
jgi:DNA-binding MarR family transcriptional regulator